MIMHSVYPEAFYDEQYGKWAMPIESGGFFMPAIGLEEVLMAMEKMCEENEYIRKFRLLLGEQEFFSKIKEVWILGKPLSCQSEDTILWLHSLLI